MTLDLTTECAGLWRRIKAVVITIGLIVVCGLDLAVAVLQLFGTFFTTVFVVLKNGAVDWAAQAARGRDKRMKLFQPVEARGSRAKVGVA